MRRRFAASLLGVLVALAVIGMAEAAERLELQVAGMVCPFCEAAVESVLRAQPGVLEADADFRTGRAVVIYDPERTDPGTIADAVNKRTFYRAQPLDPREGSSARERAR